MVTSRTSDEDVTGSQQARLRRYLPVALLVVGMAASIAFSWGAVVLVASIIFGLVSLRNADKPRTLLVALIALAGALLVVVALVSAATATATASF